MRLCPHCGSRLNAWVMFHDQRCAQCQNAVVTVGWGRWLILLVALFGSSWGLGVHAAWGARLGLAGACFALAFGLLPRWLPVRARRLGVEDLRLR